MAKYFGVTYMVFYCFYWQLSIFWQLYRLHFLYSVHSVQQLKRWNFVRKSKWMKHRHKSPHHSPFVANWEDFSHFLDKEIFGATFCLFLTHFLFSQFFVFWRHIGSTDGFWWERKQGDFLGGQKHQTIRQCVVPVHNIINISLSEEKTLENA